MLLSCAIRAWAWFASSDPDSVRFILPEEGPPFAGEGINEICFQKLEASALCDRCNFRDCELAPAPRIFFRELFADRLPRALETREEVKSKNASGTKNALRFFDVPDDDPFFGDVMKGDERVAEIERAIFERQASLAVDFRKRDFGKMREPFAALPDHFAGNIHAAEFAELGRHLLEQSANAAADFEHAFVAREQWLQAFEQDSRVALAGCPENSFVIGIVAGNIPERIFPRASVPVLFHPEASHFGGDYNPRRAQALGLFDCR
jgi:hypothetical protein